MHALIAGARSRIDHEHVHDKLRECGLRHLRPRSQFSRHLFDINWGKGGGATSLEIQDLFFGIAISIPTAPTKMRQRISRKFVSFFSESAGRSRKAPAKM